MEGLLSLPGVGPYAASAYLSFHCGKRAAIIDGNIVRLYGRVFGLSVHAETRRTKEFIALAESMTPPRAFRAYNYAVLDFTRAVCRPKPNCEGCPLRDLCAYGRAHR
jgi:A/G-specific adenine glycosylase